MTKWTADTVFRLAPPWRPLPGERLDGDGDTMAPYLQRLTERRIELFEQHPPLRNKGGWWGYVLLLIALDAATDRLTQEPMTEAWLLENTLISHRKTVADALRFYVDHGLIVAEQPPAMPTAERTTP